MAKWVCPVCGYVYEGENPPEKCPQCGVPGSKFLKQEAGGDKLTFVCEHHIGDGIVEDAEVTQGLKDHFTGECTEVGMYLAMSRQADREGYPEVAEAYKRIAYEEAEHAAKFAELLGKTIDIVTDSTKENLRRRVEAECGATAGKLAIEGRGPPRQGVRRPAEALLQVVRGARCKKDASGASPGRLFLSIRPSSAAIRSICQILQSTPPILPKRLYRRVGEIMI